jgi:hypothetical protein
VEVDRKTLMKSIDYNIHNFAKNISELFQKKYICIYTGLEGTEDGITFVHCVFSAYFDSFVQLLIVYQPDGLQHVAMLAMDKYNTNDLVDCYDNADKKIDNGVVHVSINEKDLGKFYACNHLCNHDWKKAYRENLEMQQAINDVDIDIEREIEDLQKIFDLKS